MRRTRSRRRVISRNVWHGRSILIFRLPTKRRTGSPHGCWNFLIALTLSPIGRPTLPGQPVCARREQLLNGDRLGDDALGQTVLDEFLEHPPVGGDPIRQRIARYLHDPPVDLVDRGRLFDSPGLELLDIAALRLGERMEYVGGEIQMSGEKLVLDNDGVVDR